MLCHGCKDIVFPTGLAPEIGQQVSINYARLRQIQHQKRVYHALAVSRSAHSSLKFLPSQKDFELASRQSEKKHPNQAPMGVMRKMVIAYCVLIILQLALRSHMSQGEL